MDKRSFRDTAYTLAQLFGIIALWRWLRRDDLTVFFIHGVVSERGGSGTEPTRGQISAAELDRQLGILTSRYEFISSDQVGEVLSNGRRGRKPCALFTIDDGYRSAYEVAWPILRKHSVPATVFVSTGQMESGMPFLWDRLDYAILHMPAHITEVTLGEHVLPVDLESREARAKSARYITQISRTLFSNELQRFKALQDLLREHESDALRGDLQTWVGVMSAEQVKAASDSGLDIGSHTVHHYRLGDLDRDMIREELRASKVTIEALTGRPCRTFCFPEGSLNKQSVEEVEAAGYDFAFSAEPGLNPHRANRFTLRRIHLPEHASKSYLLARTCGLTHQLSRWRKQIWSLVKPARKSAAGMQQRGISQ